MKTRTGHAGFSLLELAVTILVIGILSAVLLDRMSHYRQQVDDIIFKSTLINMRTGLRIEYARLLSLNDSDGIRRLEHANPVIFLAAPPGNYLGELDGKSTEKLPRSHWYFSKEHKNMVYLLNTGNSVAIEGQKSLNFKVKLLRVSKNPVGGRDGQEGYVPVLQEVDG